MTQKELGYIELEWTCKRCGTINPGMARFCTNCGAPISKEDKYELPDQQEFITDKGKLEEAKKGPAIQCPYCTVLNPAGAKFCLQCGGDIQAGLRRQAGEVLGAHTTEPAPEKLCPYCNQPVKANAQRCPNCGGSLVETDKPASSPITPKKIPVLLIVAGIALSLLCVAVIISIIILGNRTNEATAMVSDIHWQLSTDILEKQPVQKSAWEEDLPALAQSVSCRDEYKETSSFPVPNATEVCGTPYVIDQGSGAGKVVQDCEYRLYASYCDFTILDWVVVDTVMTQGRDIDPQWPVIDLQAGQQAGDQHETYTVTFETDGQTYTYSPANMDEFRQYDLASEWVLSINTFGAIKEIRSK